MLTRALLLGVALLSGCVTYEAFIAQRRAACIKTCHAQDRGWRIECYERTAQYPRRSNCQCPPREEIP